MDNEKDAAQEAAENGVKLNDADVVRLNGMIALTGSQSHHAGYRQGLHDAFLFSFMLVMAAITVYCYMEDKK